MTTSAPAQPTSRTAVALARPAAPVPSAGTGAADAVYRNLFDSFGPDSGGRISPLEVLALATAMLVPCLILAWLMAILFEDRTHALALWLNRRFAAAAGRSSADAI